MKLLLKKDLPQLGIVGDIVDVSPGYARNFLLPNGLATEPTEGNIRAIAKERAAAEERRRLAHEALKAKAEKLASVEVTIAAAATEEGHLYGSVGPKDIAVALVELGHEVDAGHVKLAHPIKQLDNVMVDVVLAESIKTQVKVWVVRSGETAGADEEGESSEPAEGKEAHGDDDSGT
jgi:large subunit ribosomal protein L9